MTRRFFFRLLIAIFITSCLTILIRDHVVAIYNVPSISMLPLLRKGDKIVVEKVTITNYFLTGRSLGFERGDVVIFNSPLVKNETLVKRCLGMPGDKIQLKNSELSVNDVVSEDGTAIFDFRVFGGDKTTTPHAETKIRTLTNERAKRLWQRKHLAASKILDHRITKMKIFPNDKIYWTVDNYGPIQVPKKNDIIMVNKNSIQLYARAIISEGHLVRRDEATIYIDNKPVSSYKFKNNYFFMLGDNRHHSIDSRYFGFISEKEILGKCLYILRKDKKRFFKYRIVNN